MITLDIASGAAIGPIGRGNAPHRFVHWEAHYADPETGREGVYRLVLLPGATILVCQMWNGVTYRLYDYNATTKQAWYWRVGD